jgi:hypothetical protein
MAVALLSTLLSWFTLSVILGLRLGTFLRHRPCRSLHAQAKSATVFKHPTAEVIANLNGGGVHDSRRPHDALRWKQRRDSSARGSAGGGLTPHKELCSVKQSFIYDTVGSGHGGRR